MASFYKAVFAKVYDRFMSKTERGLYKRRRKLISSLEGDILEVGSGTGINYQFYSSGVNLFALDPNPAMLRKAASKSMSGLNITYLNYGVNDKELNNHLEKHGLDAIVCTLVLCSIHDPEKAMEKFSRWLKPDGRLIILEHIHAEKKFNQKLQNMINPLWKIFADGCNINRNTDGLLEKAGFRPIESEYFVQSLRFITGVYKMERK